MSEYNPCGTCGYDLSAYKALKELDKKHRGLLKDHIEINKLFMKENKALKESRNKLTTACIEHLSPRCKCSSEYKDRQLRDPQCEYCDIGKFIYPFLIKIVNELEETQ
ncbi:hypothetical protein LCGC14_1733150 [marine sediment metagenome]|uniref:Uncharacterized protein n=1 Tax=marine sediment metagenome TaxID=412755 RepID=A0A0F9H8X9_9ZZZZ